ncbi:FAD dependent oxidoreductase [Sporomusa ovata DSM 2662]|uniref:NAD(FAD)-utilizing dehydrogenase, sll0175 homolog n=1 Tax=Sporomusa ovata TaxID=2378 RepID=A0A0U1KWS5_9FIRM|nr:NAD(P)-binding protein [Sporomusa ovata]EQB28185.1 FAD dependent oxidoreductase [Sporomusa ovata DSM 2662]CQR71715.1 NAD(FAD)-utilizing dehydrogenase, sll0175 homolog [Sporomusa ovata]
MLKISNFRVPLSDDTPLEQLAARRLKLTADTICQVAVVRKAVDARRKNTITFVYTLEVETAVPEGQVLARLSGDKDVIQVTPMVAEDITPGGKQLTNRPIVVGAGPAGLFTAFMLAKHGYKPLLIERGRSVDQRARDIADFWHTGKLDEKSNVQFGEGGAGTFSDGKLTTRVNDPRMALVVDLMIAAGAPPEIKYLHKPHIGTDKLRQVVKNIRTRIIEMGGQVEFETKLTAIDTKDGRLNGITINNSRFLPCEALFLAIGHSARDTYQLLYQANIAMEAKPFAIGVRIEHPQELIDRAQYGSAAGHPKLGAADYALVYQDRATARTAYSFCMCPGGLVVAAASEAGGVVTNGMSLFNRDSKIANSALAVTVNPADFGPNVLDGIEFQRRYERLAFVVGGHNYQAPVQTVGDFLAGKSGSSKYLVKPSYRPGITPGDLRECLPEFVTATLAKALPEFGRKIRGFDHPSAVLTGVETRTSAPVRIIRGQDFTSVNTAGLYPIGEGAGYAGGIMSAALDGMNAAISFIKEYKV